MESTNRLPSVIATVKTLTNNQLKNVLRKEGLPVTGVKSSLQLRIIDHLERLAQQHDEERFNRVALNISYAQSAVPTSTRRTQYMTPPTLTGSPTSDAPARYHAETSMPSHPFATGRLTFKESPFYDIIEPLTPTMECKVREHTRDSVELKVTLNPTVAAQLQNDPNMRVMVFCAADTGLNQFSRSDIAFPHQVELKVNYDEVRANLRGLKNRPGTTRPADITNYIRKRAGYTNSVVMTYALTQKKYYVVVNLVKKRPVEDLVNELKRRSTISKEQVIREMRSRAEDAEIVATSSVMSLKCPLSTLRIEVPCRSVLCTHNQCFDASSFLQLQEQAPTWTCPVCNKSTSFESLQIDQYVDEALRSTPSSVEQVTIEPNGEWHVDKKEPPSATNGAASANDSDNLIEITSGNSPALKAEPDTETSALQRTPSSRDHHPTPGSGRSSTNKRPPPPVIDLTLSDDEDAPPRPAKRQAQGLPDPTGGVSIPGNLPLYGNGQLFSQLANNGTQQSTRY
ncbi:hypothetical protein VTN31DRAFT_6877 [Thermomyces dupontii]|uniref:uncharacterized protein n=1 Tax=Talaromyces thermophilus TaxID=28565 RepID=UPI0037433A61